MQEYLTVLKSVTIGYEDKKSKFIANVKPIENEAEAICFIQEIKTKHLDATHNIFAYDIFDKVALQRFSDDGEPQGTAGLPVLEVIKKTAIRNVVIVITRYFGGVKLGAAGLIRAYGKSATLGIDEAGIAKKIFCLKILIIVEYSIQDKIKNFALLNDYQIKNISYGEHVEFEFVIPKYLEQKFQDSIIDFTNAKIDIKLLDGEYNVFKL